MGDHESRDASTFKAEAHSRSQSNTASTSERKLSVELPSSKHIYTIGSTVTGLVHLGTKNRDIIQEVQVSLVCVVRSSCTYQLLEISMPVSAELSSAVHNNYGGRYVLHIIPEYSGGKLTCQPS